MMRGSWKSTKNGSVYRIRINSSSPFRFRLLSHLVFWCHLFRSEVEIKKLLAISLLFNKSLMLDALSSLAWNFFLFFFPFFHVCQFFVSRLNKHRECEQIREIEWERNRKRREREKNKKMWIYGECKV